MLDVREIQKIFRTFRISQNFSFLFAGQMAATNAELKNSF